MVGSFRGVVVWLTGKGPLAARVGGGLKLQDPVKIEARRRLMMACVLPVFVVLGSGAHLGVVVNYGFTPLAMLVGYYFLRRSAASYVSLVVAMYTFAPFVRRLADWGSAYHETSPITLSPYLVALLVVFGLPKFDYRRSGAVTLLLATLGVGYGMCVSVLTIHQPATAKAFVRWSVPLLFAYFCLGQEDKEELKQSFLTTTLWVATIAAAYGIVQYIVAPPWDTLWLENLLATGSGASFGVPAPYGLRVFSTLASPGGCASLCGTGMLCATRIKTNLKYPIMLVLLTALALTMVRTLWFATAMLLPIVIWRLPTVERLKTIAALPVIFFVLAVVAIPFVSAGGSAISDRLSTFGSLKTDDSAIIRSLGIHYAFEMVAVQPFGSGIGWFDSSYFAHSPIGLRAHAGPYDTAFAMIPVELGYLGTLLYGVAILMGTWHLLKHLFTGESSDSLLAAIGLVAWLVAASENPLISYEGLLFWIAVFLTARRQVQGNALQEGTLREPVAEFAMATQSPS